MSGCTKKAITVNDYAFLIRDNSMLINSLLKSRKIIPHTIFY